ncbi:MAG: peptidylprolyl isomerase [Pseudomonadales bacterium]|jgi:FKBP-type peptidyl-prolyl cis-trans isomerase SlpA|tara:strand:- start:4696 stop:5175 length:480 start_codon:yes stop_codon:yes gene_type:complete
MVKQKNSGVPIGPGVEVGLSFSIKLEDGEVIDSTAEKVVSFAVGDGNLLPGFERSIFGLVAGDEKVVNIEPENAFGIHNEENLQRIKRSSFQSNMNLSIGLMMSFSDAQNAELPGVIIDIDDKYVDVDFNHPLAGKNILFEVAIDSVKRISNEILRVKT